MFAPVGISAKLGNSLNIYNVKEISASSSISKLGFLQADSTGLYRIFEDENFEIFAKSIRHSCFTLGYVIMEKTSRKIDMEKLKALGVPSSPLLQDLKNGAFDFISRKVHRLWWQKNL